MTELVLKNGDIAVATLRNPSALSELKSKYPATQFLVLALDVANTNDIKAAFETASTTFGKIDVVFNNAAAFQSGEAEGIPEADARRVFDVNFWGANNVTLEAIRVFRDVNKPQGGRLITISSATGFAPMPGSPYYVASKFGEHNANFQQRWLIFDPAIEGLSEAVRMELDPDWNIKVLRLDLNDDCD